jgi:hypothetical protein
MLFLATQGLNAQVGINTTTPAASSVLDVTSTTQGMLTPRMTTAQKLAITSPANGLLVYDTNLKEFSYYDLPALTWVSLKQGRTNFKRIKSTDNLATVLASELAAGGGTKYLLDSSTYYEINGQVVLNYSIELNNAYLSGLDTNDDKLVKTSGDIFTGSTGGTVKLLTLVASTGNVFNINGGGTGIQNFIFRDSVIANSASVGTLQGFNMIFSSIVQYSGNTTGILYKNITKLLLNNQGWFGNNLGTFEKLEGTFGSVQKQGGFSEVNNAAIGFDVSLSPTISVDGTIDGVNFLGTLTTGKYVNPYTGTGTFTGYNFTNKWTVTCPGLPFESDRYASGNTYLDRTITYPTIGFPSTSTAYKIPGTTISTNLFRMSDGGLSNRMVYNGRTKRTFIVSSTISMQASGSGTTDFLFYFVKFTAAGAYTFVVSSETFVDSNSSYVQSFPITGTVELAEGEYVELYAQRLNGSNKTLTINSFNMSLR